MTDESRPPIVVVAGAWLGGWAWRDVARHLRAAGHDVHPATLTGLGERVYLARPEVNLETHIADVVNLLDHGGLEDAMLVGHSCVDVVLARRPPQHAHHPDVVGVGHRPARYGVSPASGVR